MTSYISLSVCLSLCEEKKYEKYKILRATTRNFEHLWLKALIKDVGGGHFEKKRNLLISSVIYMQVSNW